MHKAWTRVEAVFQSLVKWVVDHLAGLAAFGIAGLAVAAYGFKSSLFSDEGLAGNVLTEALGILITVIVIDRLVGVPERRRSAAARRMAYAEIRTIYVRLCELYRLPAQRAVQPPPTPGTPLLDHTEMVRLAHSLDLNSAAPVSPPMSWASYLKLSMVEETRNIDRAIQRYLIFADPVLLEALRKIESCPFLGYMRVIDTVVAANTSAGRRSHFPFPSQDQVMQWFPIKELYEALLANQPGAENDQIELKPPVY